MTKNILNPKVDFYFDKAKQWQEEINELRRMVLDCHLVEDLKWGCPCYSFENKNIVLIHVYQHDVLVLKAIARTAPLQVFHQVTVKNHPSQFIDLFLPLFGFIKIKINFRIQYVLCHS